MCRWSNRRKSGVLGSRDGRHTWHNKAAVFSELWKETSTANRMCRGAGGVCPQSERQVYRLHTAFAQHHRSSMKYLHCFFEKFHNSVSIGDIWGTLSPSPLVINLIVKLGEALILTRSPLEPSCFCRLRVVGFVIGERNSSSLVSPQIHFVTKDDF